MAVGCTYLRRQKITKNKIKIILKLYIYAGCMARNAGLVDQRGHAVLVARTWAFWVGLLDVINGIYTCNTVNEVNK